MVSNDPQEPQQGQESADPRADRVAAAVRTWQRHLVDLGGRNTLLWYRDLPSGTLDLTTAHPGGLAMLLAGRPTRLSDLVREPAALEEARRRARLIRAKTLELHEERGITAGFIAVGMATWEVPGIARPPAAPVLLRRCTLRPTGASQQDFDVDLGDDVELNPVLVHYLRSEQGIEVDADALADLATAAHGFDPHPVFAELTRACRRVPGFRVAPRLVVGTFSYNKLPMVADLAAQGAALATHDVIAALAGDPDALHAVRQTLPDPEPDRDPADERLVLDADSSQQAVVDDVRAGAHLVVDGPPGTGKSQTIANLVAALAAEGKRVLLVAEKRAAIETVVGRLDRLGLGDLVLDVHDGAANRRRLAVEIGAALERNSDVAEPSTGEPERTLLDRRTRLVDHLHGLHEIREPWGVSAYEAQVALSRLGSAGRPPVSRVRLGADVLKAMPRTRMLELGRSLAEAGSLGAWTTDGQDDPWYAARVTSPDEAGTALDIATRLSGGELRATGETMDRLLGETGLPASHSPAEWARSLSMMTRARDVLDVFRPEVFDAPLDDLVGATANKDQRRSAGSDPGGFARLRLRRLAHALLRPGPPPADLHAELVRALELRDDWQRLAGPGSRPAAPEILEEAQRVHQPVADDLAWLGSRLAQTSGGGDLTGEELGALQRHLQRLADSADRLSVVPRVVTLLDELRDAGLGPLVDDLARRGVPVGDVPAEVEFVWWTSLLADLGLRDPRYGSHDGEHLRHVAEEYVAADHAHLDTGIDRARAAVARRVREALADHPDQGSLVRAEAGRTRRHRSLHDLVGQAGDVLLALKPCWAMSPLVVASVLPPGRWFDVVIFDEASQIPPAHAVSAISRAGQVVVVGDDRQLAPSTFSTSAADEHEEPEAPGPADGSGSVLDALSGVLPVRRLTWHYRSLDERLIAFANERFYDGSLVTFPGTGTEPVLSLEVVDGVAAVEQGEEPIETTDVEVGRVVELVLEHARTRPHESLGVIALGNRHAARIQDALRRALTLAPDVSGFFHEDALERFFVKQLDRVQGDERDAIIVSVGYGKTPHGRVLHRFGPLSADGGERRLNVAITRARRRMTVVAAFTGEELDPTRLRAAGALLLRDFLLYAASGGSRPTAEVTPAPLHPLVDELARRLRAEGLVVRADVGLSAHRLDLAVEDPRQPGRALVAVEADGPVYASMSSTRERDRLRVEQLRRLGWQHVRVWTTDLFRDPARDVSRVTASVWAASNAAADDEGLVGAGLPAQASAGETEAVDSGGVDEQAAQPASAADPAPEQGPGAASKPAKKRRFRRAEQTRDDTDVGWGERPPDESAHESWLQEQRPPHWE